MSTLLYDKSMILFSVLHCFRMQGRFYQGTEANQIWFKLRDVPLPHVNLFKTLYMQRKIEIKSKPFAFESKTLTIMHDKNLNLYVQLYIFTEPLMSL